MMTRRREFRKAKKSALITWRSGAFKRELLKIVVGTNCTGGVISANRQGRYNRGRCTVQYYIVLRKKNKGRARAIAYTKIVSA